MRWNRLVESPGRASLAKYTGSTALERRADVRRVDRSFQTDARAEPARPDGRRRRVGALERRADVRRVDRSFQTDARAEPARPDGRRRRVGALERRAGAADAAEDHERVLRYGFPHELRARLDLAVEPLRKLLGLLLRRRSGDHVPEPARHAVALRLEARRELRGFVS